MVCVPVLIYLQNQPKTSLEEFVGTERIVGKLEYGNLKNWKWNGMSLVLSGAPRNILPFSHDDEMMDDSPLCVTIGARSGSSLLAFLVAMSH